MEIECILSGFGIRGYSHYRDDWNLQKHDKKMSLACKTTMSEVGETLGVFLGTTLVGNMPSVLTSQENNIRLKRFLKNFQGCTEIVAMVTQNIPRKGERGMEVPCEFYLRGRDRKEIRTFLENVRTEVNKLGKQTAGISCSKIKKISKRSKKTATEDTESKKRPLSAYQLFLRAKWAEITSQNQGLSFGEKSKKVSQMWQEIDPRLKEVYERKAEKLRRNIKKDAKGGSKRRSNQCKETKPKAKGGSKRRSDQCEETKPKVPRTEKNGPTKEEVQGLKKGDGRIILEEKDLDKICNHVGKNWRLFGKELGISDTRMDHIQSDSKSTILAILDTLKAWKQENFDKATLYRFIEAMNRCQSVRFDKKELNKIFQDVRKRNESQRPCASSTEQL